MNDGRVHIRDSKYRRDTTKPWHLEPVISISTSEFARLIDHVRGTGDGAVVFDEIVIEESEHEGVTLSSRTTGAVLHFHDYEWAAFRDGAIEGEFSSACRAAGV